MTDAAKLTLVSYAVGRNTGTVVVCAAANAAAKMAKVADAFIVVNASPARTRSFSYSNIRSLSIMSPTKYCCAAEESYKCKRVLLRIVNGLLSDMRHSFQHSRSAAWAARGCGVAR